MMIRRLFWLLTVFSLTGVVISSLALFAGPSADVAQWAGWSFLGLSRPRWESLHYGCGVLLFLSGLVTMMSSGRRIMASGEDESDPAPIWITAIIVFTVIVLSSVLMLPPGGTLEYMSGTLKAWHAKSFGEPPLAGAADLSPTELAKRLSMDPGKALINLATHNVKLSSPDATIAEIARQNGLAPAAVYETLRGGRTPVIPAQALALADPKESKLPPPPPQLPADPPPGLGRLKLVDVCEQYGLNLEKAVETLAKSNIRASGDMTLRQIAQSNLMLPVEVYDILRGTPQKPYSSPSAPAQSAQAPAPVPAPQTQPAPAVAPAPAQQVPAPASTPAPEQPAPAPQAAQTQQPAPAAQQPGQEQAPEGLERMTLAAYCRDHGLDPSQSLAKLKSKGIVAFSDMTFRELAIENNLTPAQVLDLMVK